MLLEVRENYKLHWANKLKNIARGNSLDNHEDISPAMSTEIKPRASMGEVSPGCETDLLQAIKNADLLIASGGGYMVNADDPSCLFSVLDRLEMGVRLNKPAIMVGQGVDHLLTPVLVEKARKVLPMLDYIFIREKVLAPKVLAELGVSAEHIIMTGDDAVEMVYKARKPELGRDIGINLRVAQYTNLHIVDHIASIKSAIHKFAKQKNSKLIGLPISHSPRELDIEYIREIIGDYPRKVISWFKYTSPNDLIYKASKCRVVVTGAFHPAVFALAQGIPAVCIYKSNEYHAKFLGLQDEFGEGCQIISLNSLDIEEILEGAIYKAWENAETLRPQLLSVAKRQMEIGRNAYRQIFNLYNNDMAKNR